MAAKKQSPLVAFITLKKLRHDGTPYEVGEEIQLTTAQAQPLLATGTIAVAVVDVDSKSGDVVDISIMTKAQLLEHAKSEHDLELSPSLNKDELISAIAQAAAEKE